MDFVETVFSFIPLLMIVFFFVRLASAAKKKNRQNSSDPGKAEEQESGEQKQGKKIQSRLESLLQAKLHKSTASPAPPQASVKDYQPAAAAKPVRKVRPSPPQTLNTLNNSKKVHPAHHYESIPQKENARERVSRLPELKKAVIWSEILGKPKGLD